MVRTLPNPASVSTAKPHDFCLSGRVIFTMFLSGVVLQSEDLAMMYPSLSNSRGTMLIRSCNPDVADLCWTSTSALDPGVTIPTLTFENTSFRGLSLNELRLSPHCRNRRSPGISSRVTNEGVVLKGMISSTKPKSIYYLANSRQYSINYTHRTSTY